MIFFFDRCMSPRLARMIHAYEAGHHTIVHHDDDGRFSESTKDVEWLAAVGSDNPKPVVISGDSKILKRPDEARELRQRNLMFFCMLENWTSLPGPEMAWKLLKLWPQILALSNTTKNPTIFEIRAGSSLKIEPHCETRNLPHK